MDTDLSESEILLDRYTRLLYSVVHRSMSEQLRTLIEPDEMVQTIFRTIIRRAEEKEKPILESDEFFGLVKKIAERKIMKKQRHHLAQKRDMNRVTQLTGDMPPLEELALAIHDPSAEDGEKGARTIFKFMQSLELRQQQIFSATQNGQPLAETAKSLNCTVRTVSRELKSIREQFTSFLESNEMDVVPSVHSKSDRYYER